MREFQERKRRRHFFYSKWMIAILLFIVLLLANAVWNIYKKERASSIDRAQAAAALTVLKSQAATIKTQVDDLQTPQGIEEEIRRKYNVSKQGEGVAVIVGTSSQDTSTSTENAQGGFWHWITSVF